MAEAGDQPTSKPTPPTRRGRKRKAPMVEPDLVGMVLEMVMVIGLEAGETEMPLPEAKVLEGWVPPKTVSQV